MSLAFVFPGQGSQSVGMLGALGAAEPVVQQTFAEASAVLGYDLWALCQQGPEADLGATERTQPAMLAAGVATWRVWTGRGGPRPVAMAGHSLGEYTALVCSGAVDFADGRRPRAVSRTGHAAGRAARAGCDGRHSRPRRRRSGRSVSRSGPGRGRRAGEFQRARTDGDCRQRRGRAARDRGSEAARRQASGAAAGQRAVAQQPHAERGREICRTTRDRRRSACPTCATSTPWTCRSMQAPTAFALR